MDALRDLRDGSRRLVLELVLLAGLAWVATTLPPEAGPLMGWDFIAPVLALCAHVLLGALLIVEATVVLGQWWSAGLGAPPALPVVGAAGILTAAVGGAAWLAGVGGDWIRLAMACGWSVAMVMFVLGWRITSAALARALTPRTQDRRTSDPAGEPFRGVHR